MTTRSQDPSDVEVDPHIVVSDAYDRSIVAELRRRSGSWQDIEEEGGRLIPHFDALLDDLFCALFKYNVELKPPSAGRSADALGRPLLEGLIAGPAYAALRHRTLLEEGPSGLGAILLAEGLLETLKKDRVLTSGDLMDLWQLDEAADEAREAEEEAAVAGEVEGADPEDDAPEPESLAGEAGDAESAAGTEFFVERSDDGEPGDDSGDERGGTSTGDSGGDTAGARRRARREAAEEVRHRARVAAAVRKQKRRRADDALRRVGGRLDERMTQHAARAALQVDEVPGAMNQWGQGRGGNGLGDAARSIDLGRRLVQNPKLSRIARVFGRMRDDALAARRRTVDRTDAEIYDIAGGGGLDAIARLVPHELRALSHPALRKDFLRRLLDGGVQTYRLQGTDSRGYGPMVVCLDVSSSMSGEKELWSKAVALTFVELARRGRRRCHVVCFSSGPDGLREFDMNPRATWERATNEAVDLAEWSPGGGTDFVAPLEAAMEHLRDRGMRKSDLILITDGECQVPPEWEEEFLRQKRKQNFALYTILVDVQSSRIETAARLSDRLARVTDLTSDTRTLFTPKGG